MDDEDDKEFSCICSNCIGNEYLKRQLEGGRHKQTCSFCNNVGFVEDLETISSRVEIALGQHYQRTSSEPDGVEWALAKEGLWERAGDQVAYVISEILEIDEIPAEAIRANLEEQHSDLERDQMGEEGPFDEETCYMQKNPDDLIYKQDWEYFEHSLKTESRFFSRMAKATLDSIFGNVRTLHKEDGQSVLVKAGTDQNIAKIYRARVAHLNEDIKKILAYPAKELGSPPFLYAKAGRMNPKGISVFYGADEPETAIAEVRPPVGSNVITACFNIIQPITLLDVEALRDVYIRGDIMDPDHLQSLEHALFLKRLANHISRPVMPDDEPFDYLTTQAIAEYLGEVLDPKIDGIIFKSVQAEGDKKNIVLFHHASKALSDDIHKDAKIEVSTSGYDGDGYYEAYSVYEKLPPPPPTDNKAKAIYFEPTFDFPDFEENKDIRNETLKLDTATVTVHYIQSVKYTKENFSVSRQKIEYQDDPYEGAF